MKQIKNIDKYLIYFLVFLYPLFFLPLFPNFFETPKLLLISFLVLLIILIKIIKSFFSNEIIFKTSIFDFFVICFMVANIASTSMLKTGIMDGILLPGTMSFVLFGALLYIVVNQLTNIEKKQLSLVIVLSAIVFAIVQLLSFTGIVQKNFVTFGNFPVSLMFLVISLTISIRDLIKYKNIGFKSFFAVSSFIIFISTFTLFYLLLPNKITSSILPSIKTSWSVTTDSLKQNPFFGVGPGNFILSYSKFRPITENSNSSWNLKFTTGANSWFTILSESGIVGFLSLALLFAFFIYFSKSAIITILLAITLILPFTPSFFPIIFLIFAIETETKEVNGKFSSKLPLLIVLILPFVIVLTALTFGIYKVFYPEYLFGQAMKHITKDDANSTYQSINKAIKINPYVDRYHLAASEIEIAIAEVVASKEDVSDEDKVTIANLIQQSINEGKSAVSVANTKVSNWESLGDLYVKISPSVKDSADFAIQTYSQAIFLNPIDPNLRIKLGNVYFGQKKYSEAIKSFELAVLAKPNLANAHFSLGQALKENGQEDKAKLQFEATLSLLDINSEEYQTVKKEIDLLNKQ